MFDADVSFVFPSKNNRGRPKSEAPQTCIAASEMGRSGFAHGGSIQLGIDHGKSSAKSAEPFLLSCI